MVSILGQLTGCLVHGLRSLLSYQLYKTIITTSEKHCHPRKAHREGWTINIKWCNGPLLPDSQLKLGYLLPSSLDFGLGFKLLAPFTLKLHPCFPGSPACRWQITGLPSLHDHVSQFHIINLFLYIYYRFHFSAEPWLMHSPTLGPCLSQDVTTILLLPLSFPCSLKQNKTKTVLFCICLCL